jgi:hypothetical protein
MLVDVLTDRWGGGRGQKRAAAGVGKQPKFRLWLEGSPVRSLDAAILHSLWGSHANLGKA